MKSFFLTRTVIIIFLLFANVSCDQISKNIARKHLNPKETITLLNNRLTLIKVENTGAFLSLGTDLGQPYKFILLTLMPIVILIAALFYLIVKTDMSRLTTWGVCFFIGGGIGNVYDRILYGSVTDFLHLDLIFFETGIFNMADLSITTGVIILLLGMLRDAHMSTSLQKHDL